MIWILLVLLTVVGGAAAVGIAVNERRKSLGAGGTHDQKALPAVGDNLVERTVRDLKVDDVLTLDGRDFLCEGMIDYDEDGHRWKGGRVVDNKDERWLVLGIERVGATTRMMQVDTGTPITGYPPEALVIGDVRFVQDKRGTATCALHGELGALSELKKGRPDGHVERCRWWLYTAPGEDTLLVEQWGTDYRVLKGKKMGEGMIELIPGS